MFNNFKRFLLAATVSTCHIAIAQDVVTTTVVPTELPTQAPTSPTPVPTLAPTAVAWPNQILALQYELHETGFNINSSPENKMSLLQAAEDLINDACLDISRNRNFEKPSTTSRCNVLVDKILNLDPKNPAAICAKSGSGSQPCRIAYDRVSISMVRSDSIALKGKDIAGHIATQFSNSTEQAIADLGRLTSTYYQKQTDEVKKQIIVGYATAMQKECSTIAYEVDFEATTLPTPTLPTKGKPFEGVLQELTQPKIAAELDTKPTHRRLISATCLDLVDRLRQLFADSYPITCISKTYFSPQCRDAMVAFRKMYATAGKDADIKSPAGDIGRF